MFRKTVYAANFSTSEIHSRVEAYFSKEEDAIALAELPNGWYGARGYVTKSEISIYDSLAEYRDSQLSDKKKAALAKLTDEEQELLGLK
jgi:hypothetical protein